MECISQSDYLLLNVISRVSFKNTKHGLFSIKMVSNESSNFNSVQRKVIQGMLENEADVFLLKMKRKGIVLV